MFKHALIVNPAQGYLAHIGTDQIRKAKHFFFCKVRIYARNKNLAGFSKALQVVPGTPFDLRPDLAEIFRCVKAADHGCPELVWSIAGQKKSDTLVN